MPRLPNGAAKPLLIRPGVIVPTCCTAIELDLAAVFFCAVAVQLPSCVAVLSLSGVARGRCPPGFVPSTPPAVHQRIVAGAPGANFTGDSLRKRLFRVH